jgi:hypothetical protein
LDHLGADLAAEEERLDAERARFAEAWGKLHEVVETNHKIDATVHLCCEETRREAKEIRESATAEAEEILEEAREKLTEEEAREGAIAARKFVRKEALSACEKALEGALAAREKSLEEAFAACEKAREEALTAREETAATCEGQVNSKLRELQRREEEAARHENNLELGENELRTKRSRLETLEI